MKKLIILVATLLVAVRGSAQALNPQNTFSNAVSVGNPSLWLNFNDAATSFVDSVSGLSMTGAKTVNTPNVYGHTITPTGAVSAGYVVLPAVALTSGNITAFSIQFYTAPVAGAYTFVVASGTAPSALTIATSFTVNIAATTAVQTFSAPANFTAVPVTAGEYFGYWASSSTVPLGYDTAGGAGFYYVAAASGLPSGSHSYTTQGGPDNLEMSVTVTSGTTETSGAVTTRQPGFDNTNGANYAAKFNWNAWSAAPNVSLSRIDWNIPWTMLLHIDRLNWDHVSPMILASKGDLNTVGAANVWWKVYVQTNTANSNGSQLCFARESPAPQTATSGSVFTTTQTVCSPNNIDAMPNGFNYDIVIEDAGTGANGTIGMWINGTAQAVTFAQGQAEGFGGVRVTVSGGTGYAATTAYTSTGGGAACVVQGLMYASGGVPTTAYSSGTNQNAGCIPTSFLATGSGTNLTVSSVTSGTVTIGGTLSGTGVPAGTTIVSQSSGVSGGAGVYITSTTTTVSSAAVAEVPTIVLTSPTGAGARLTATTYAMTMNSSVSPLVVPGYYSNGVYYGPGGSDATQNPLTVDEFALFPGNLTFGQVTNIFYETKFYQNLLYAYAKPPKVVLESCCCGPDYSGDQTMGMVIGAHHAGLIQLVGTVDDDGNANGSNSVGWWRQMLDQAGLNDVAVSVGPNSPTANVGGCPAASITAYNASTAQNASSYESSVTMYRTILAANPTTPVDILLTQGLNGYTAFLQSPGDSISPLTGLQLAAQNQGNGAIVNLFEGNLNLTPTAWTYLTTNNGNQYLQIIGGTPAPGGPGIYVSRTALDPLYTAAVNTTEDTISGWTNMQIAQILSPYFFGGVEVSASGGAGYAGQTAFTSVGGGPSCHVSGLMDSTSGVPNNNFTNSWGGTVLTTSSSYNGIGYGCTPAIFTATGSGTSLTVSAVSYGVITVGDTISGPGVPAGTILTTQVSGTTGGVGVYTTSIPTTASAATITRTPTLTLTSPTGTGVTLTAALTFAANPYGAGSNTNQFRVYPNGWAQTSGIGSGNAPVYTWFQNSLMDPPTTGAPRPY